MVVAAGLGPPVVVVLRFVGINQRSQLVWVVKRGVKGLTGGGGGALTLTRQRTESGPVPLVAHA